VERNLSARIALELSKKHQENLFLGEYVMDRIRDLGVPYRRYRNRPRRKRNPNGSFLWKSSYSPIIGWFHKIALGLLWHERTTSTSVKMDWILTAPRRFRIWFLRGIADSDGNVNIRNKLVEITTSPNTLFFHRLFLSLGIKSSVRYSRGYGYVGIKTVDAAEIAIFNPRVLTHRRQALEKLSSSRSFQRHWPAWLESEVSAMISRGLGAIEIRDMLLEEHNVYTKVRTIRRKIESTSRGAFVIPLQSSE
jgi:hypothetical protein